jgi:hypothetical protein
MDMDTIWTYFYFIFNAHKTQFRYFLMVKQNLNVIYGVINETKGIQIFKMLDACRCLIAFR